MGKAGRCPRCSAKFLVPSEEKVLEESVADWLVKAPGENPDESGAMPPVKPSGSSMPQWRAGQPGGSPSAPAAPRPGSAPPFGDAAKPRTPAPPTHRDGKPLYRVQSAMRTAQPLPAEEQRLREEARAERANVASTQTKPEPMRDAAVRDEIRLHVLDVTSAGVTLGFNATLLLRPAFRASMPLTCISCGELDVEQLIARPLAWLDKATNKIQNAAEIEKLYEVRCKPHQTVRELVQSMRAMDGFIAPFNAPMPYFVCTKCVAQVSIFCQLFATPEGVQCEAVIPASYALKWFGRVNGVCGDDYANLESQVVRFENEAWRSLPHPVRGRISAWWDFKANERFVAYFSDSDFAKKDAGLGGIVISNTRLAYCKYHVHGDIPLDDADGEILIVPAEEVFFDLYYHTGGQRKKLVRLRADDATHFASFLNQMQPALRVIRM